MNQINLIENIPAFERGSRLVLSAVLIGAVLARPDATPAVLALIALYPAFTALMAWDPIYAVVSKIAASVGQDPVRVNAHNPRAMVRGR